MPPGDPLPDRTWLLRLLAVGALVPFVAALVFIATVVEVSPQLWRVLALGPLLALFGQFAVVIALALRRNGPAAFAAVPARREFRAVVRQRSAWAGTPLAVYICLQLVHPGYWTEDGGSTDVVVNLVMRGSFLLAIGAAAVPAVLVLLRPAAVVLTPEGVRQGVVQRLTPWDVAEVRPTGFLRWPDVHPAFLSDVIAYYRAHPEFRSAIGTPEEHRRLFAAVASARVHAGVPA